LGKGTTRRIVKLKRNPGVPGRRSRAAKALQLSIVYLVAMPTE